MLQAARHRVFQAAAATLVLGFLALGPAQTQTAQAANRASTVIYNLYGTDGYVTLADGTPMYTYGFIGGREGQPMTYLDRNGAPVTLPKGAPAPTAGPVKANTVEAQLAGNAQFPAPVIYASTNDVVEIRLKNLGITNKFAPNDPHSIHLHGLDVDAANDGVPETSIAAVGANSGWPGAGNVVVYMFAQAHPGTYFYHCHQEADIHVTMGMYGALIVYNPTDAGATGGPGAGPGEMYGWKYDKDYVLLLSDTDIGQHISEERALRGGGGFNPAMYKPQYWFVNGLSFPNTIHADGGSGFNWANWIQAHPGYDPFVIGSVSAPSTAGTPGTKVLIRMMNLGFETHPMHLHGYHFKILGSDARGWPWANAAPGSPGGSPAANVWGTGGTPFGQGLEKNTLTIGSGEAYELLIDIGQQRLAAAKYAPQATDPATGDNLLSKFPGGTQSRYNNQVPGNLPVSNTQTQFPAIQDPFSAPLPNGTQPDYVAGPQVDGAVGHPIPGNQLFPWHNHDDYKATNNGTYPGGMFTMVLTTP